MRVNAIVVVERLKIQNVNKTIDFILNESFDRVFYGYVVFQANFNILANETFHGSIISTTNNSSNHL